MIRVAELQQDQIKKDLGIGIYDSKSLKAIRAEGKSNVSDLIKYASDDNHSSSTLKTIELH
jgi:hypothetical protein